MNLWVIIVEAIVIGIMVIYLGTGHNKLRKKYEDSEIRKTIHIFITLNGDRFEFKTGDEFYYAISSSDGSMEAMKEVCHGVTIREGNIYITYFTHSMYCFSDMYSVLYDICGKTEAEAIEKMRKKICCNNNSEDK